MSLVIFKEEGMNINVTNIKNNGFTLEITDILDEEADDETFASRAHAVVNHYIVALNVCSLGLFWEADIKHLSPNYGFINTKTNEIGSGIVTQSTDETDLSGRVLDQKYVVESLCLYGALVAEENKELISEYLKGLVHLSLNYPGVYFEKDAFSNFYRAFEHLVTNRILKKKKLKNELKEMISALSSLGSSPKITNEFRELYSIRCEQAMHAQKHPKVVSRENAMKMKVFADIVIRDVYKPIWQNGMKDIV